MGSEGEEPQILTSISVEGERSASFSVVIIPPSKPPEKDHPVLMDRKPCFEVETTSSPHVSIS